MTSALSLNRHASGFVRIGGRASKTERRLNPETHALIRETADARRAVRRLNLQADLAAEAPNLPAAARAGIVEAVFGGRRS